MCPFRILSDRDEGRGSLSSACAEGKVNGWTDVMVDIFACVWNTTVKNENVQVITLTDVDEFFFRH